MSALGIWNNRYEGGPCYAACMETFTLYPSAYLATIPLLLSAGRDAITQQDESTPTRDEWRHRECANDSQLRRCLSSKGNFNPLLI